MWQFKDGPGVKGSGIMGKQKHMPTVSITIRCAWGALSWRQAWGGSRTCPSINARSRRRVAPALGKASHVKWAWPGRDLQTAAAVK